MPKLYIVKLKVLFTTFGKSFLNGALNLMRRILWPKRFPHSPKKICVHRVGQIGDLICALPAICSVRQRFPAAELVLLTSPGLRGNPTTTSLLAKFDWIDQVKTYYSDDINSFENLKVFVNELRKERFDAWIQLPQDLTNFRTEIRNMFFVKILGIPWAGGFRVNTIKIFRMAQAARLIFPKEGEVLRKILADMEIQSDSNEESLLLPEEGDVSSVKEFVAALPKDKKNVLALAPGGKRVLNRWPADRFAQIGRRWVESGGWVVVVGGESEKVLGEQIETQCGQSVLNLCGQTSVLDTTNVLKQCGMLVTNDSGPMHLAALVGTPCIAVFSGRDFPHKWYPRGEGHIVFRKEVDCSPCFLEECPNDHVCLTHIQVDDVWQAVMKSNQNCYASVI